MRVEFASGQWVEIKGADQLTAGDKLALHSQTALPVNGEDLTELSEGRGRINFTLGMIDEQLYSVLSNIISAWSYPFILPRDDISKDETGKRTWEESLRRLPLDDWNELEDATEPHMAKLQAAPKGKPTTSTSSRNSSGAKGRSSRTG